MPPIRIALLGAGIFARNAHLPALHAQRDTFEVAAIYSRKLENAQELAGQISPAPEATDDLTALLARDDIEAVDIVLPIHVLPDMVERALAAGKHVISEKPIAPTVERGSELLHRYWARYVDQVWMAAENWRYEPAFMHAAQAVQAGQIGTPKLCHWALHIDFSPDGSRYYHTTWRLKAQYAGGPLLDGGVHHIAALRMVVGEVVGVCAALAHTRDDLPYGDTLSAALEFENGALGSYGVTYAVGAPWAPALHVAGDAGALWVQRGELVVTNRDGARRTTLPVNQGLDNELAAFAAAIREGRPHRNTPEQAVQDVAVIEALLQAAETGQRVAPARVVG